VVQRETKFPDILRRKLVEKREKRQKENAFERESKSKKESS